MEKACAFLEARSSPQALLRAGKSSSSDPLLLYLPLLLPLHFSIFSTGVGNCRNESSCLLQTRPKRRHLVSLRHKTTSFWFFFFFFFKSIQNDVVLDLSHLPKRRRFELPQSKTTSFWTATVQNNVVLDCSGVKKKNCSGI